MTELPPIIIDGNAAFFVCPLCCGKGVVQKTDTEERRGRWFSIDRRAACSHCFGFGRLPVPSWYREQGGER